MYLLGGTIFNRSWSDYEYLTSRVDYSACNPTGPKQLQSRLLSISKNFS